MNSDRNFLAQVLTKTGGLCGYCGVNLGWLPDSWHIEHIIPRSRGGTDDLSNLVSACRECNMRKYTSTLFEYRKRIYMELSDALDAAEKALWLFGGIDEETRLRISQTLSALEEEVLESGMSFYFERHGAEDEIAQQNHQG